jgi:uncharacterized membrane protein
MSAEQTAATSTTSHLHSNAAGRRRTTLYIATALVSLPGLADAIYLTVEHVTGQSVRCTIVAGCQEVLSSSYSVMFGFPLAAIGAASYFAVFSIATLAAFGYRLAGHLLIPLVGVMCITSLWLIYLQAFVIRAYCQYCLFSAAVTFTLTILVLVAWRIGRKSEAA